jgi:hypothetical protein
LPQASAIGRDDGCEGSSGVQSVDKPSVLVIFALCRAPGFAPTSSCCELGVAYVWAVLSFYRTISDLATRSATEKNNPSSDTQLKPPPQNYITSPQDPIAPSPVASDVTNFEDVDEVEEEETERESVAGFAASFNASQRPSVTSPLKETLQQQLGATPLRVRGYAFLLIYRADSASRLIQVPPWTSSSAPGWTKRESLSQLFIYQPASASLYVSSSQDLNTACLLTCTRSLSKTRHIHLPSQNRHLSQKARPKSQRRTRTMKERGQIQQRIPKPQKPPSQSQLSLLRNTR